MFVDFICWLELGRTIFFRKSLIREVDLNIQFSEGSRFTTLNVNHLNGFRTVEEYLHAFGESLDACLPLANLPEGSTRTDLLHKLFNSTTKEIPAEVFKKMFEDKWCVGDLSFWKLPDAIVLGTDSMLSTGTGYIVHTRKDSYNV